MRLAARSELRPKRVAMIGCGAVADLYYAPALKQLTAEGLVEVAGAFDPDPTAAARYPIWYEPQALVAYRTHGNSNTGRHYRFAEELHYTAKAIELFSPYLPPERARSIARQARANYAHSALRNAERMALLDDRAGMRAHVAAALRLSWSPSVLRRTSRLLAKVIG